MDIIIEGRSQRFYSAHAKLYQNDPERLRELTINHIHKYTPNGAISTHALRKMYDYILTYQTTDVKVDIQGRLIDYSRMCRI